MANPCIVTFRGKDYSYGEWVEYLAEGGLDELIKNGELSGLKSVGDVVGRSFEIKGKEDVYKALKDLGYSDVEAKDNASLMEVAADAAQKRYGIDKNRVS